MIDPDPFAESDVAVIGTGQARPNLAITLATLSERVASIEVGQVGGLCVNRGYTPTKTLRKTASAAHLARRDGDFGIRVEKIEIDFAAVTIRVQQQVGTSLAALEGSSTGQDSLTLLSAGGQELRVQRVFQNSGARAFIPPLLGIDDLPHLNKVSQLQLRERPRDLIITGGGNVSLETGQIFRRLASELAVIEANRSISGRKNGAGWKVHTERLPATKLRCYIGNKFGRVKKSTDAGITATVQAKRVEGYPRLVATERSPNTERLNLAAAGVQTDEHGLVPANDKLQTNVLGTWAVGVVDKRCAFACTSDQDSQIVLTNLEGGARFANDQVSTYAMSTGPLLCRPALSQAQARESKRATLVSNFLTKNVSWAKEESDTAGLMQILVEHQSEEIVGALRLGSLATK